MRGYSVALILTLGSLPLGCEKRSEPGPSAGASGGTPTPPPGTSASSPTPADTKVPGSPSGGAAVSDSDVILLGEVGSLTGSEATFGISTRDGIELALKEANQAGGVKGKKVAVRVYDDQGKPEEAANAVTRLISQDRVKLILGEVASSNSLAMAPKCQSGQVPMITPSSTNPKVTAVGDYIFRVCFIDPFQGFVMAKFAKENLKFTRAADRSLLQGGQRLSRSADCDQGSQARCDLRPWLLHRRRNRRSAGARDWDQGSLAWRRWVGLREAVGTRWKRDCGQLLLESLLARRSLASRAELPHQVQGRLRRHSRFVGGARL